MWQRIGICIVMFISLYSSVTNSSLVESTAVKTISHSNDPLRREWFSSPMDVYNTSGTENNGLKALETLMRSILFNMIKMVRRNMNVIESTKLRKTRVKRQGSGAGKYADAAKIDNIKAFRIYLTMFKNLWSTTHAGGRHPLDTDVPKPIVQLFKARIMEFFFPPIGADPDKS